MPTRYIIITCLLLVNISITAQVYTPETVPNTRLSDMNHHVSDPDGVLGSLAADSINILLSQLEQNTSAEVAVVALASIGEADEFDFAQALFNKWGIGKSSTNNGLLILLVNDKRTVRFHTGYGLEGILPDIVCKQIQEEIMVPSFREGDIGGGMVAGVSEVVKILSNPVYAEEIRGRAEQLSYDRGERSSNRLSNEQIVLEVWKVVRIYMLLLGSVIAIIGLLFYFISDALKSKTNPYPEMRNTKRKYLFLYFALPLVILISFVAFNVHTFGEVLVLLGTFYLYLVLLLINKRLRMNKVIARFAADGQFSEAVNFIGLQQTGWVIRSFLLPVPAVFFLLDLLNQKKKLRDHPRKCKCGREMYKLQEEEDDAYLKENQVFEESLNSIDYDVWLCPECSDVRIEEYKTPTSIYKNCPRCKTNALVMTGSSTISAPTYSTSGTGLQIDECKYCHHKVESTFSIPILAGSGSSGSSGDSSGSSSSGGSSGGSYGGGSSGGGGASSSW